MVITSIEGDTKFKTTFYFLITKLSDNTYEKLSHILIICQSHIVYDLLHTFIVKNKMNYHSMYLL